MNDCYFFLTRWYIFWKDKIRIISNSWRIRWNWKNRSKSCDSIFRETIVGNCPIILTEDKSERESVSREREICTEGEWKVARRFRCGQSSGNHREGIKKEEGGEEAFGADKGGSLEKRQRFLLEARSGSFGQRKPNKREENLIRIRGWPREASSLSANRYRSNKADWFAPDNGCRTESSRVLLLSWPICRPYTLYCIGSGRRSKWRLSFFPNIIEIPIIDVTILW